MSNEKKSKKKIIIIAIIVVLVLVFILSNVFKKDEVQEPEFETAAIEKKTLTTTISSTGKITTENSKTVTSQLMNYKITGVNVKVGDTVNVGDVLCTFDTATLAQTVNDLKATVSATNVASNESVLAVQRAAEEAERTKNNTLDQLNKQMEDTKSQHDNAVAALDNAKNDLSNKQNELTSLQGQVQSLTTSVNNLQTEIGKAQADKAKAEQDLQDKIAAANAAQVALDTAKNDPNQLQAVAGLERDLVGALNDKNAAETDLKVKENTLAGKTAEFNNQNKTLQETTGKIGNLQGEVTRLSASISGQSGQVNALWAAYDAAKKAYDDTAPSLNTQVANAQGQVTSTKAQTSVSTLTVQEQITAYSKQLEDTNLKSTVAGTVTAVSAKAGDYYTGGALLVIEGAESFVVESEIDEYDIADIAVGMEVNIKTDATRDEVLQGQVISVAPAATNSVASSSMGVSSMTSMPTSTGSGATYTVKIAINTQNDRLRLGMNSKISIITKKSENILAVPYDAVNEKEDGTKFVTLIKDDNSEEEVNVTLGLESGYYTEVSSDKLKEGMKVKIPKVESSSSVDELLNSMGATAGM